MGHSFRTFRLGSAGRAVQRSLVALCVSLVFIGLLATGCALLAPQADPYADIRQNLAID